MSEVLERESIHCERVRIVMYGCLDVNRCVVLTHNVHNLQAGYWMGEKDVHIHFYCPLHPCIERSEQEKRCVNLTYETMSLHS